MGWSGQWRRVCQGEECVRAELEASEIVARVDRDVPRDMGTGPQDNTAWELGEAARGEGRCGRGIRTYVCLYTWSPLGRALGEGALEIRVRSPLELFELRECNTYTKR